jgi:putative ABC transport system permease protein
MTRPVSNPKRQRSQLRPIDVVGQAVHGLTSRKLRTALTALGISIGIASLISIQGITEANQADARAEIDALGSDFLFITPGTGVTEDAELLPYAPAMLDTHLTDLEYVAALYPVDARARRNELIPEVQTGGVTVSAVTSADLDLLEPVNGSIEFGRFHDPTSVEVPAVVLGSLAAERLGIRHLTGHPTVNISGTNFSVIGVLDEFETLNTDLNRTAIIGLNVAAKLFETPDNPGAIYAQVRPEQLDDVRDLIPAQANPFAPGEVAVSRPTEALEIREVIDETFARILQALALIVLAVGGIGIANIMVISVIERRGEIGLRRSLGATRKHIASQFIVESTMLSLLGGVLGVAIGVSIVVGYARYKDFDVIIPWFWLTIGVGAAFALGAVAGLYPAWRASRLDPAEAVRPAA